MSTAGRRASAGLALALALVWPATILAASTAVSAQVCPQSFAATTLSTTEPPSTTNDSAALAGTAEPYSTVNVKVGGIVRATLTAGSGGNFAAAVPLVIGDNVIAATATDGAFCADTSTSPAVLIHRDEVAPAAPSISAPVSGQVTTGVSILVQGSAEAYSSLNVYVNGKTSATLTLGADGLFAVSVPLGLGNNSIQASATNSAGTGPLTAALTVTRQPVSLLLFAPRLSAHAPTPTPAAPSSPAITSPTSDTATTASQVTIHISGRPAAPAAVSSNGTQVATAFLASDGTAAVSIPLTPGENLITINIGGTVSPVIAVYRNEATPQPPIITAPDDGLTTTDTAINLSGTAPPGSLVTVHVGATEVATVTAGESGDFAVRADLSVGLNLVYVSIASSEGQTINSSAIQITREASAMENAANKIKISFTSVVTVPVAAAVLTTQGLGEVLGATAASPRATAMVLGFTMVATTVSTGLLGLELLLMLPGLLRLIGRRVPHNAIHGRVVDAVTGKALTMAKISSGKNQLDYIVSGMDGRFAFAAPADGKALNLRVARPGFQPAGAAHPAKSSARELIINLEPSAAQLSAFAAALDLLLGAVSWLSMIFSAILGAYLVANSPSVLTLIVALLAVGLLAANIFAIVTKPRYRWGRITDSQDVPISGAVIELAYRNSGAVVSAYLTDRSGRYTLHAPTRGIYRLTVSTPRNPEVHSEPITIRRRSSYLGFGLKLPR